MNRNLNRTLVDLAGGLFGEAPRGEAREPERGPGRTEADAGRRDEGRTPAGVSLSASCVVSAEEFESQMTTKSKLGQSWPTARIQADDKKSHATLKALRDLPGNRECAECRASPTTWASVSLGVFVCMDCAQVHRSLGTHISKVKSCMGTYLWCPDELERMKQIGNARAWALYTGGAKGVSISKPAADSPQAERERFARDKYERKRWMHPGGMAAVLRQETQSGRPEPRRPAARKKATFAPEPEPEPEGATPSQLSAPAPVAPVADLLGLGLHWATPAHSGGVASSTPTATPGGFQPAEFSPCPQCYVGQLAADGVCANPHCPTRRPETTGLSVPAYDFGMLRGEPPSGVGPTLPRQPQQPQPLWQPPQQPQQPQQPLWQPPQQPQPLWQQPLWQQQRPQHSRATASPFDFLSPP